MFLKICMQIHSVVFALSRQINKQKYAKTINPLCAGNNVLWNIKLKGEGLTANPSLAHAIAYKLSALPARISEETAINAMTQQFINAKISGCTLKQGVKHTYHCVRAIYSCKMRLRWCLVEYEQSSIESVWLDRLAHIPVCKNKSCKTTQELRICMKYRERESLLAQTLNNFMQ